MALLRRRRSPLNLCYSAAILRPPPPFPLTNPFTSAGDCGAHSRNHIGAREPQSLILALSLRCSATLSCHGFDAFGWGSLFGRCDCGCRITMNFTNDSAPMRKEMIETYDRPLAKVVGRSVCKVSDHWFKHGVPSLKQFLSNGCRSIHTSQTLANTGENVVEPEKVEPLNDHGTAKVKRKKLKGKRAVVRWLKFFRWKKKKEYQRMTTEEKILYKLRKAKKKEERMVEALNKIEPKDTSETTHDPEILTPEEHFYFLKMGHKCKNYVPVGRRGIFQGVILNMHLHWKKHQTVKVIVKTFTPEEVREIAAELARLSGGIVLDIHEENTIIMYRGKNYAQPPTEIMSPKISLSRKKALDKSKHRDALRAVRRYIPRLEQDLGDLQQQMKREGENQGNITSEENSNKKENKLSSSQLTKFDGLEGLEVGSDKVAEDDYLTESSSWSEPEDLSDIFETDSDGGVEEKPEKPLYLDVVDKFPSLKERESENFEEHLKEIAAASKRRDLCDKDLNLADLDDIDKIFLRASSLLKRKRR